MRSHLTTEEILKFTGNFLTPKEYSRMMSHIEECGQCYDTVIKYYRIKNNFDDLFYNWTAKKHAENFIKDRQGVVPELEKVAEFPILNLSESSHDFELPDLSILSGENGKSHGIVTPEEIESKEAEIRIIFSRFGIDLQKINVNVGNCVTVFRLESLSGRSLSEILKIREDIISLINTPGTRMVENNKSKLIELEIPNIIRPVLNLKNFLSQPEFFRHPDHLPVIFGQQQDSRIFIDDLNKLSHLLIAGSSGSGKSVYMNTLVTSLLFKKYPGDLKFVFIDSDKNDFDLFSKLNDHYIATSKDVNEYIIKGKRNVLSILKSLDAEMKMRYDIFSKAGVRNVLEYNIKYETGKIKNKRLPYLIVMINEMAEVILSKEAANIVSRLAQLGKDAGIHFIAATRYPSNDIMKNIIKPIIPSKASYKLDSELDSVSILNSPDAAGLMAYGDMLYLPTTVTQPIRIQSPYISDEDCGRIADFVSSQRGDWVPYFLAQK